MKLSIINCAILTATLTVSSQTIAANKPNVVGLFLGATQVDSETDYAFGLEYERRLNADWGVGLVYEHTPEAHHSDGITVALASVYYHYDNNWRFGLGVGEEKVGGGHPHSETLLRVSAAYDIHFQNFGIAPTLALDFTDGSEATVFGVAFTYAF